MKIGSFRRKASVPRGSRKKGRFLLHKPVGVAYAQNKKVKTFSDYFQEIIEGNMGNKSDKEPEEELMRRYESVNSDHHSESLEGY